MQPVILWAFHRSTSHPSSRLLAIVTLVTCRVDSRSARLSARVSIMETFELTWRCHGGEDFTPAVSPDDLRSMWNAERDYGAEQCVIARSPYANFLSHGANLDAVVFRGLTLRLLSQLFERQEPQRSPDLQKKAERFLNLRGTDAMFTVMARFPIRWQETEKPGFLPFDLEQFLNEVEREAS